MTFSAADITEVTRKVTKEWAKQRKAEERGRRSRSSRVYVYSNRVCFTDVAKDILPGAYAHASGNGKHSVSKRTFYYCCRKQFQNKTGEPLEFKYFANTLLVQFMNRNPRLTASWRVTADPRGTLTIPNAAHEVRVPVGTLAIEDHLRKATERRDPFDGLKDNLVDVQWPSLAAGHRYQAVLYIEKEGFEPLLEEGQIAEKYDLAVISCKGQSVVAARRFVDQVCAVVVGVPLLVVHDFDKAGFEISQRLTTVSPWAEDNDRVTYRFRNAIDVTDLGLRLEDVEEYGLEDKAEECDFKGGFARDSIATDAEKEFLESGRRVELNAFTSPEFLEWLEGKLDESLPGRLIPPDDVLADAYRRAHSVASINRAIEGAVAEAVSKARDAEVPKDLRRRVERALSGESGAWDEVLYDLVSKALERRRAANERGRNGGND
jgi:hypothetical protein